MRLRLHHVLVLIGLAGGVFAGTLLDTEPAYIGWLFSVGGGLAGGAFLAAVISGDGLASGPAPQAPRGGRGRPAWFDEDEHTSTPPDDSRN